MSLLRTIISPSTNMYRMPLLHQPLILWGGKIHSQGSLHSKRRSGARLESLWSTGQVEVEKATCLPTGCQAGPCSRVIGWAEQTRMLTPPQPRVCLFLPVPTRVEHLAPRHMTRECPSQARTLCKDLGPVLPQPPPWTLPHTKYGFLQDVAPDTPSL